MNDPDVGESQLPPEVVDPLRLKFNANGAVLDTVRVLESLPAGPEEKSVPSMKAKAV